MLISIHIENIAVIKSIDVDFTEGFNVLTGQTGAGKSIIIDAINLILGARADRDLIRSGEERALVSAVFAASDNVKARCEQLGILCEDELMVSREVSIDGKSVARINGRSVSATVLREITSGLVTIHGQHDSQDLLRDELHIVFLDDYAECAGLKTEYAEKFARYSAAKDSLDAFLTNSKEKARKTELLSYQLQDIESARLKDGEEEKLTETKKKLKNYEKINKSTSVVYRALCENDKGVTACSLIDRAVTAVESLSDVLPDAAETAARLEECRSLLTDIAHRVDSVSVDISADPDTLLTKIESRLAQIDKLKAKYGSTIKEILEYRDSLRSELDALENSEERLTALKAELDECMAEVMKVGKRLSEVRRSAAAVLEEKICEQLAYLDMTKVRFCVKFDTRDEPAPDGIDQVEFLISANAGEEPPPLAKVASGGELSRVMLALKCVFAEIDTVSLMIFDEIDTGISGKTSVKIGKKLRELSSSYQVMCVTHSAQIASLARNHLLISKEEQDGRVYCHVTALDSEGRINEISRIIGGEVITDTIIATAKELLSVE
ncbi:MAG: DNA repair protein RecN [Clostridia bacterium]|nr:DNA repair protein RecN [Clostridia bacterium]